jgi:hypothetical protein
MLLKVRKIPVRLCRVGQKRTDPAEVGHRPL